MSNPVAAMFYKFPTPPGSYLPNDYVCQQNKCQQPPCGQICNFTKFSGVRMANLSLVSDEAIPLHCTLGHWCNGNRTGACPAGVSGDGTNFSDASCGGECPLGAYCPEASVAKLLCPGGSYGDRTALKDQDECRACPAGSWCAGGDRFLCANGTYNPKPRQHNLGACIACEVRSRTTTRREGSTSIDDCVCDPFTMRDLSTANESFCVDPPAGFAGADVLGTSTLTVHVEQGYWRPSKFATAAHPCPLHGTCAGGDSPANFSLDDASLCRDGFKGPYCTDCVEAFHYVSISRHSTECRPCEAAHNFFGFVALACVGAVAAVVIGFVLRAFCRPQRVAATPLLQPLQLQQASTETTTLPGIAPPAATRGVRARLGDVWRRLTSAVRDGVGDLAAVCRRISTLPLVLRLRAASEATAFPNKLKICLGVSLIAAQIGDVYQIRYPPSYQSLSHRLFAPLRGELFGWIPGLRLSCIGIERLVHELVLYTLLPVALVAPALAISWCYRRSLVPALPFVLRFTYVVFPIISSKGFQALAECDTFHNVDGSELRLLPSDWHVECPINGGLMTAAWLAILLYGVGVPLLYAQLLWRCRDAILSSKPDALSRSLAFLHSSLHPSALWWPLIEAARALILTGFFALLMPGSITQLLCGLMAAISFLVLQIWCAPYELPSSNFLAVASAGLALQFVTSLGVQVNSQTGHDYVNGTLLSIGLYVAAFAVIVFTLISFLASRSLRIDSSSLRMALHDLTGGDGQLSVRDIIRALNEPMLTKDEVETLRSISLHAVQAASATSDRYTADAAELLLSEPEAAARGVAAVVGLPYVELLSRMSRGVQAIVEESDAHGTDDDKHWLDYVMHQPAAHHEGLREEGRAGQLLSYFVNHPNALAVGLEEPHVVALRWYTSPAYESLNRPLRDPARTGAHPFAVTIAFISDGIKRLRAIEQPGSGQNGALRLWRGMRNVQAPDGLRRTGGTERAMLSTTTDLETAVRFSTSRSAFLFLITPRSFLQRGTDTAWLSCFPNEQEVLYPPCTYLKPTGRVQAIELSNELRCTVVEMTPHHGS